MSRVEQATVKMSHKQDNHAAVIPGGFPHYERNINIQQIGAVLNGPHKPN